MHLFAILKGSRYSLIYYELLKGARTNELQDTNGGC